ncbi:MAG TPA: TRAP transporter small permease, partial [Candidatus Acidoferrum sp.]|nr:TRAP transporter small permease [Candidatus Acidoferrum sp.]
YLAMASTFLMMCLTTADAAGRYFFNFPLLWAYEFTETYLLVATVYLGTSCAYREGGFIRVTFFLEHLSSKVQAVLNLFAQVVCILLGLFFIVATIYQTPKAPFGVTLDVLPSGPGYVIVLVGLLVVTLVMGFDLLKGKSGLTKEESKDY